MHQKLRTILASKALLILTGLLLAYFLFGYFAVDPIAKRVLPWVAENKLASRMTVSQVEFDPLGLSLTVINLRLTKTDGAPLAGFERLFIDLETQGLFKFAWRLRNVRLTAPHTVLDIAPDGRFNWADVIAKLNEDKTPEEDANLPRVLIDHILIERGNIEYTDRHRAKPFKTVLRPLGLELEGLSTLPESRGDYLLSAKLPEQGGTVKWKGDLALNPLASKGAIEIEGINLAKLMQVANPQSLPFHLKAGELDSSLIYDFALAPGAAEPIPQVHLSNISIKLSNTSADLVSGAKMALEQVILQLPALNFTMHDRVAVRFQDLKFSTMQFALTHSGRPLLSLPQAEISGVDFDTALNQLRVDQVLLRDGAINALRAQDGSLDWQQLASPAEAEKNAAETTNAEADANEPLNKKSATTTDSPPFSFEIASVQLQNWQADFADHSFVHPLRAGIKNINLGAGVSNAGGPIAIHNFNAELGTTALQSALYKQPIASLEKASLQGGQVSLKDNSVSIAAIRLSGLQTEVLRDTNKSLNWQTALAPAIAKAKPEPRSASEQPSDWKVTLNELALGHGSVHFVDKSTPTPVVLDVSNATLDLRGGSLDLSKPLPVKAAFQLKQGGRFEANGKVTLAPFKTDLQVKLSALSLPPFSPYINQLALLKLKKGQANLHGKLTLASAKSLTGRFNGGFSIDNLAINEETSDALFLGWRSVSSNSLRLKIAPDQLQMSELRIVQPIGKFIIYEDSTLNVSRVLRKKPISQNLAAETQPKQTVNAETDFPVVVERISIVNGDLEFADLSLTPQFGTHINTLSGVINSLSTNPATTAQVELDGKVDEYGSARIRGSVQPFRATEYTNLKLVFRNLEMNRLTPYSGKFAGRKIDSGKLSVDLEYKIKERQLAGDNKFVIEKLKLGERVESAEAVNLPLDLAIALLQDRNGLIDLDLPISGNLDDPQFSYGKIIWKAFINVIGKVVTSPFRALGNLLGISSDKLEAVAFEPGKSDIAPEEQEQLKAVGEAMAKRPTLTLDIVPTFDPVADKAALQEEATRRDVATEMGLQLDKNEMAGPVDLNNPKTQTAVENLLKDRKGEKRDLAVLDSLQDYFRKPKPEDLPKYTAMLEQLKTTVDITGTDLSALAQARAVALQNYLVEKVGLKPERILIAKPATATANNNTIKLKLELGVANDAKTE